MRVYFLNRMWLVVPAIRNYGDMTVLSRQTIRKYCGIDGMVRRKTELPLKIEPVSIDVHLSEILVGKETIREGAFHLPPNIFCLGSLDEKFSMPDNIVGFVEGKSTVAREGLQIHAAGLIDPGFRGDITLEIKNLHHFESYRLEIGELIGQVYFQYVDEPVDQPYGGLGSHYQDQSGVTPSYRKII